MYKSSFYQRQLNLNNPNIVHIIGARGSGKTTFCQQFVDEYGKNILEKTITPSGNSTIIQTDIVILEETENRLFLKARSKWDILRDVIIFALSIDLNFKFDLNKGIYEKSNRQAIKLGQDKDIKLDTNTCKYVYNLFRRDDLMEEFLEICKDLQREYFSKGDIEILIAQNIEGSQLGFFIDNIIRDELGIDEFYGRRHEIGLDSDLIIEKTIISTKKFNKYKDKEEDFKDIVSYRILFEHAVLVLNCDEQAKRSIPDGFSKGLIFKISQTYNQSDHISIETDFNHIENRILLIPAGICGELIDDRSIDEFKNVIISDSKRNVVVITKLDKTCSHESYRDCYSEFIDNLKDEVVTTHNSLIDKLGQVYLKETDQEALLNRNDIIQKLIVFFDSAYLSNIQKRHGEFDHELHKIVCKDKEDQLIEASDIEDIVHTDTWYDLLKYILQYIK